MQRSVLRMEEEQNEEEKQKVIDDEHWVLDLPQLTKREYVCLLLFCLFVISFSHPFNVCETLCVCLFVVVLFVCCCLLPHSVILLMCVKLCVCVCV